MNRAKVDNYSENTSSQPSFQVLIKQTSIVDYLAESHVTLLAFKLKLNVMKTFHVVVYYSPVLISYILIRN